MKRYYDFLNENLTQADKKNEIYKNFIERYLNSPWDIVYNKKHSSYCDMNRNLGFIYKIEFTIPKTNKDDITMLRFRCDSKNIIDIKYDIIFSIPKRHTNSYYFNYIQNQDKDKFVNKIYNEIGRNINENPSKIKEFEYIPDIVKINNPGLFKAKNWGLI